MSYEYKELIEQAIIDDDRPLDWEEGFKELDEVYAQAPKSDEYEAKAKAFDRIVEQRKKTGVITLGHHAWEIIREYESGELE